MAHCLLFSSTYNWVPVASVIDMKIRESLEKSGSAKNIALWNWTPLQKSLLDADLSRVIMTSHWSTGKTGILFEKALKLAREGNMVVFVLHYSQINESKDYFSDYAPILLYHSLMNEISQEKAEVADKIKLMVSKDLREDLVKDGSLNSNVHIFIYEFIVNDVDDLETIDDLCEKIDVENHIWVTVAKASALHSESFKKRLAEKKGRIY